MSLSPENPCSLDGRVQIVPILGLPELGPGDDLAELIAQSAPCLCDGDVVVVTSKAVSKVEGQLLKTSADPPARENALQDAITNESVEVVASRGELRITRTKHGLVLAAAGVDASNLPEDEIALLPADPDASAERIRQGLRIALDVDVAVIVSDTMGRPFRHGQVDTAIGVAGISALRDYRGMHDSYGNLLAATIIAQADEIASAAELVKGKTAGVPVVVLRGLSYSDDRKGAAPLLRDPKDDLFRLGTDEALALGRRDAVLARRSIRRFTTHEVESQSIRRAISAAITAPAPHHTTPWRFVVLESAQTRTQLLDAMQTAWEKDLAEDGFTSEQIARRIRRGDVLRAAPMLIVPCLVADGRHNYPDARRLDAERTMFHVAIGAAVENLLVTLASEGLGSCWVSSTLFCPDIVRLELKLVDSWHPMGAIAVGYPAEDPPERTDRNPDDFIVIR